MAIHKETCGMHELLLICREWQLHGCYFHFRFLCLPNTRNRKWLILRYVLEELGKFRMLFLHIKTRKFDVSLTVGAVICWRFGTCRKQFPKHGCKNAKGQCMSKCYVELTV